jgi:hypothetical protein
VCKTYVVHLKRAFRRFSLLLFCAQGLRLWRSLLRELLRSFLQLVAL